MAIDYPGKLFPVIGKYVKTLDVFFAFLTQISTGITDIETILESNTLNRLTIQLHPTFELMKRDVERWTSDITGEVRTVLTDRDFIEEELVLDDNSFDSIMQEIINDMIVLSSSSPSSSI